MENNKNKNSKIPTPAYVDYYSMHRDPFSQKIEPEFFYAEPSRQQRLGTLQHLTQFGNEIMIVTGSKGSGKTALLQQFFTVSPKLWKFARIEAKNGLDERKILQQIYRQMGMDFRGATHNDLLEQMRAQFEILQRKGIYCVMLVDNADQLPIMAIKKIMEMASLISTVNKPLLRIILFGTDILTNKLKDPLLNEYSSLQQRSLDLQPFSEEQTSQYVMGRLAVAHFIGTELFTPSVLHKIYTESYGWPARINELSRNILINSLPKKKQEPSFGFDIKTFHTSRLIGLALTVCLVASFFIFQKDINGWINKLSGSNSSSSAMASTTQAKTSPTPSNDILKPSAKTTKTTVKPTTSLAEKLKQRDSDFHPKLKTASTTKAVPSQPNIKVAKIQESKSNNTSHSAVNISTLPRKESWILSQHSRHYTLQIVAGENLKTIEEFIAEHKLHNNIAFYRSVRKNKPWYGLIYGVYTHKQAATTAIKQLPKNLQRLKPWVRSINSVKLDIYKTRP
jgi:DamX protein